MNKLSLSMLMSTLITSSVMASSNGKIETSFTGLDSDGDELLTSSELEGTSLAPYLENIDTNGDSAINLSEFNEYVKANTSKFSEDVIATVDENSVEDAVSVEKVDDVENSAMVSAVVVNFEKADINEDGTLSSAEVSKALDTSADDNVPSSFMSAFSKLTTTADTMALFSTSSTFSTLTASSTLFSSTVAITSSLNLLVFAFTYSLNSERFIAESPFVSIFSR